MSNQSLGRKRTFKVIHADGSEEQTTVQTVGLQKTNKPAPAVASPVAPPVASASADTPPASVPEVLEPSAPTPIPEPPAAVPETGATADATTEN